MLQSDRKWRGICALGFPEAHSLSKEDTMKLLIYSSVLVLVTATLFPSAAEAFSRRPHHDEVPQQLSLPYNGVDLNTPGNDTPTNVPEPSSILLLANGIGLLGIYAMRKRFHRLDTRPEKELQEVRGAWARKQGHSEFPNARLAGVFGVCLACSASIALP